mgnify:CR=1 FL=1
MYINEKKVYKAKVNGLYVKSVSLSLGQEITVSPNNKYARYLNGKEKDFLLKCFPDAEIKELTINENGGW